MNEMLVINASDARREWSSVIDSVVRQRPAFIKRTRDTVIMLSEETVAQMVSDVQFTVTQFQEEDDSITLSLDSLDIISHGEDIKSAKAALAENVMEYAEEYYQEFELYSKAPNRKGHLIYVIKALTAKSSKELEDMLVCQNGKS